MTETNVLWLLQEFVAESKKNKLLQKVVLACWAIKLYFMLPFDTIYVFGIQCKMPYNDCNVNITNYKEACEFLIDSKRKPLNTTDKN